MIEINLLPGAGRKRSRGGASKMKMPAALSKLGKGASVSDPWMIAAAASLLVAAGAVGWMWNSTRMRSAELAEKVEQATQDSTRYAGVSRDRLRAEATRDTVLRQLNIIRGVDGERFIWPHVLDEVSRVLPAYTWLTSIIYAGTAQGSAAKQIVQVTKAPVDTAKADSTKPKPPKPTLQTTLPMDTVLVRIVGQTVDIQALTRFMRDLEQSPFLERVQLEKSELVLVQEKEATQFSLLTYYTRPDSTAVRRAALAALNR